MASRPDFAPPAGMAAEIGALCALARHDAGFLYGRLLRENVAEVLRCSFPRFSAEIDPGQIEAYADGFVAEHPAERPPFHHIAAEFVCHAQRAVALPRPLLDLLEYEWVLLAVEIDPAEIEAPGDEHVGDDMLIALNPTAQLLVLPLAIIRGGSPVDTADTARSACAVYRTRHHGVASRALSYQDCLLLDAVRDVGPLSLRSLVSRAPAALSEDAIRRWVADGAAVDLLTISPSQGDTDETVPLH